MMKKKEKEKLYSCKEKQKEEMSVDFPTSRLHARQHGLKLMLGGDKNEAAGQFQGGIT